MTTINDGTPVEEAFAELAGRLIEAGYTQHGPDGWLHPNERVLVTIGYASRQFRVRWFKLSGRYRSDERAVTITNSESIGTLISYINMEAKQ